MNNDKFSKKVNVQIISEQSFENKNPQTIKYMTTGVLKRNKDNWELIYKEPKDQGFSDSITTILIGDNKKIHMDRIGSSKIKMLFDKGRVHVSSMSTPYGDISIQFLTTDISSTISYDGGELKLDYSINHQDEFPLRTKLDISVEVQQ